MQTMRNNSKIESLKQKMQRTAIEINSRIRATKELRKQQRNNIRKYRTENENAKQDDEPVRDRRRRSVPNFNNFSIEKWERIRFLNEPSKRSNSAEPSAPNKEIPFFMKQLNLTNLKDSDSKLRRTDSDD
jgi:hypothetical protein